MNDNGRNHSAHRNQRYGEQECKAAVELLQAAGWTFDIDYYCPYNDVRGWWRNENHPTKCNRTGDSKGQLDGAIDTIAIYTEITPDDVYNKSFEMSRSSFQRMCQLQPNL